MDLVDAWTDAELRAIEADMVSTVLAVTGKTCTITRNATRTPNGRFGYATSPTTVATDIPCALRPPPVARGERREVYADKLQAQISVEILVSSAYAVMAEDTVAVGGGTTYRVAAPPRPAGPFGGISVLACAAVTPLASNP